MILKSSQIAHADSLSVKSLVHFVIELEKLFKRIGEYLLSGDETVSTAESVTAGFLQFSFSQMKDASQFFKGGMTAYTLEEKVNLLDVDALEARQYNSVSPHIAETMALQVVNSTKPTGLLELQDMPLRWKNQKGSSSLTLPLPTKEKWFFQRN